VIGSFCPAHRHDGLQPLNEGSSQHADNEQLKLCRLAYREENLCDVSVVLSHDSICCQLHRFALRAAVPNLRQHTWDVKNEGSQWSLPCCSQPFGRVQ
jgi:hypothetical protein